jgi:hypothetical protein
MPAPTPVAFHEVSQHEDPADAPHRPVRRRRQAVSQPAAEPLQIVETAAEASPAIAPDDELPRRTKPRRRRSVAVDSGPLQIVETQPGAETPPAS